MSMRLWLCEWLRGLKILQADYLISRRATYPDVHTIRPGELIVVEDAGVRKWACLQCPGGCGATLSLSLNPGRRPCWSVKSDVWLRPSIEPSIHQTTSCRCHFWLTRGRVRWCGE